MTCTIAGNQYDRCRRRVAKRGTEQTPDLGSEMVGEGLACQCIRYSPVNMTAWAAPAIGGQVTYVGIRPF